MPQQVFSCQGSRQLFAKVSSEPFKLKFSAHLFAESARAEKKVACLFKHVLNVVGHTVSKIQNASLPLSQYLPAKPLLHLHL